MYLINNNLVIVWSIEDIIECAKDRDITLTKHQAQSVLVAIAENEDSSIGVNWDVINAEIDKILINNPYSQDDVRDAENSAESLLSGILGDYIVTSSGIGRPSEALSNILDATEKALKR